MSSYAPVPYVAPWVTQWNKYSTQLLRMPIATISATLTIPDGQWWRIVYLFATYTASATVGNRIPQLTISPVGGGGLVLATPVAVTASVTSQITYGIGLNSIASATSGGSQFQAVALLDMLWPQGTVIGVALASAAAGDAITGRPSIAVEIYTEFTDENTGDTGLVLTPLLS